MAHTTGIRLFTIGFTGKTAERFFGLLRGAGVERVIDVRTSNTSQLAGFTKRADLPYFLRELAGIGYTHLAEAAPTLAMMRAFRRGESDWRTYAKQYLELIEARRLAETLEPRTFDRACLLCSEPEASECHRRVLAEYLRDAWAGRAGVDIVDL